MSRAALLPLVALLAACDQTGIYDLRLVFPPGTMRLPPSATRVRLSLDSPARTVEAPVAADGSFSIALEAPADGSYSRITLEALDAAGAVVAIGRTPPVAVNGDSLTLTVYVSPPDAFALAPVALDPPRARLGAVALPYGALLAGGLDGATPPAPSEDLVIYNVFTHTSQIGLALPAPRAGLLAVAGPGDIVELFGGSGAEGDARADFWAFDTGVAPAGEYVALASDPAFARTDARAASLGGGRLVVTGDPPLVLDAALGTLDALGGAPAGARTATAACRLAPGLVALSGPDGVVLVDDTLVFRDPPAPAPPRVEHAAVSLPGGGCALVGGGAAAGAPDRAIVLLAADGTPDTRADALASPRAHPAVAVTRERLVVAGGAGPGGAPQPDAEVLPLPDLAPATSIALAGPRAAPQALTLPNEAVLLFGGTDGAGAPVGAMEVYQP
jgi:hypothetical protein